MSNDTLYSKEEMISSALTYAMDRLNLEVESNLKVLCQDLQNRTMTGNVAPGSKLASLRDEMERYHIDFILIEMVITQHAVAAIARGA